MRLLVLFLIWFFCKYVLILNNFEVYNLFRWFFFFGGGMDWKRVGVDLMFYVVLWILICKFFCDILVFERVYDYKICNCNFM